MIGKLISNIKKTGAPIVAGLDPMLDYVPSYITEAAFSMYGETLEGAAEAIWVFNKGIIDAVWELIPAIKPQIAMYEQFGLPGLTAYKKTVDYARSKGLIVIGDIKRGDIGSTSGAYAAGHIGRVQVGSKTYAPFDADMITVNPYMGSDAVNPFIKVCNAYDKGLFILVKTSNPSSGEFQDQLVGQKPVYELVAEMVNRWGETCQDPSPEACAYTNVGAVVGATYPEMGRRLRELMPRTFILVPGYGAQGGQGKDLTGFFDKDGLGAIVNSSRGIIAAWKKAPYDGFGERGYAEAARAAVLDMREDIRKALG